MVQSPPGPALFQIGMPRQHLFPIAPQPQMKKLHHYGFEKKKGCLFKKTARTLVRVLFFG